MKEFVVVLHLLYVLLLCEDNIPNTKTPSAMIHNSKIPNVPYYPMPKYLNYNLKVIVLKLTYNSIIKLPVYN